MTKGIVGMKDIKKLFILKFFIFFINSYEFIISPTQKQKTA